MIESDFTHIWVYLSASPLFGLSITLLAYSLAHRFYLYVNANPLLNPVVTAVIMLILMLLLFDISYQQYFAGAQFIHFLLGPATVALAVPLYRQFSKLKKLWLPVTLAIISGVMTGALSSISIAWLLGASSQTQLSLAPKSVTTPVAMGISERIGGLPSLTAVLVVMTGILGALLGTKVFSLLGIRDDSIKGIAMGVAAHGVGTARAFQVSQEMGAFSGLAMALSAFATAVILPWLLELLGFL
ncbi:LrgB family protein [Candidatus Venteria ishoeyi]|uniref:Inner membrane protein YohK n=1 Tax=Candidatus Venteria ishoeyi TaxID=1899563 RepID=A0A1H6FG13_9GAMM|nr:LrgB family protein [Candidatus Venteria ishoeyi]MDM8545890.1 LrgB family protein [Candidatus Venteria ishoeyi]SEH08351.1 Inner membrane protein YohK [Candidatus Venteria ishoeyi]